MNLKRINPKKKEDTLRGKDLGKRHAQTQIESENPFNKERQMWGLGGKVMEGNRWEFYL